MSKNEIFKEISSWVVIIILVFVGVMFLNSKVFAKYKVEQSSMENTLFNNQQLIVDKLSYNFGEPNKGDIIIFLESEEKGTILDDTLRALDSIASLFNKNVEADEKHRRLVKRVIAVAGDEVDIKDGYVYVNGDKLEEPYVKGDTIVGEFSLPIKVEENKLFVLGDHRTVSEDSRDFGVIDIKQVEGKVLFRVYPVQQMGKVE